MMDQLPGDPAMLLSVINTKLRDQFDSFDELCESLDVDPDAIKQRLAAIGTEYMPQVNQFR